MQRVPHHRPTFLNLALIQLPVGALTSITHRITGILLVLGVPCGVYLLDLSLRGEESYAKVITLLGYWPVRMTLLLLAWGLAHHAFAGIRHLLMDIDVGSALTWARRSAWLVNVGALAVFLLAVGALL